MTQHSVQRCEGLVQQDRIGTRSERPEPARRAVLVLPDMRSRLAVDLTRLSPTKVGELFNLLGAPATFGETKPDVVGDAQVRKQ